MKFGIFAVFVISILWFFKPRETAVVDMKRLLGIASNALANKKATSEDVANIGHHIQETIAKYAKEKKILVFAKSAVLSAEKDVTEEVLERLKR